MLLRPILTLLVLIGLSASAWSQVSVSEARVRLPIPGQSNAAAYMNLVNASDSVAVIEQVSCQCAARAELHSHTRENGMMKMRKESSLSLPAGGRFKLEPGGWHIMLFEFNSAIRTGEALELTLTFADGRKKTVTATAESLYDGGHHQHHH